MTKKEIIDQTQKIVNEYLGHSDLKIGGQSWTKKRLLERLQAFKQMIKMKRDADKVLSKYTVEQLQWQVLTGQFEEGVLEALEFKQKASEIWHRY